MNKVKPITEGEIIELTITSIGRKGDGVGKYNDFIIMVPQSQMGKTYKVKVTDIHPSFAFAIIMEVL